MSSVQANLIKSFKQQGYALFSTPGLDPLIPESRELVSHNDGVLIGPDGEHVPFRELLRAGAMIEDRYHEGAGELLGKLVAHRTHGRFPERWVGVSTGDRKVDEDAIDRIASYVIGTFSHLIDNMDIALLERGAKDAGGDLFCVATTLDRCLEDIAEREVHPQLAIWRGTVRSVVENFMRGVHVARVNQPLRYDEGSMLAFLMDVSPVSGVYIGTKHNVPFAQVRKDLMMGMPIEKHLNLVGTKIGMWLRVYRGQPFKATSGVTAELVMRDGQQSAKLLHGNVDMALTDDAKVGPGQVKRQIVGPAGPVKDSIRTWKMRAGQLYLRGVEFVAKDAEPFHHKSKDKYRHIRVMDGAVQLIIKDGNVVLEAGESALVLPGVSFMVGTSTGPLPSSYVTSTLTVMTQNRAV